MNVDDVVADVRAALELNDDDVLVNVIVVGEYITLAEDAENPDRRRLAYLSSDELEPWTAIGMLRYVQMLEDQAIGDYLEEGEDK